MCLDVMAIVGICQVRRAGYNTSESCPRTVAFVVQDELRAHSLQRPCGRVTVAMPTRGTVLGGRFLCLDVFASTARPPLSADTGHFFDVKGGLFGLCSVARYSHRWRGGGKPPATGHERHSMPRPAPVLPRPLRVPYSAPSARPKDLHGDGPAWLEWRKTVSRGDPSRKAEGVVAGNWRYPANPQGRVATMPCRMRRSPV